MHCTVRKLVFDLDNFAIVTLIIIINVQSVGEVYVSFTKMRVKLDAMKLQTQICKISYSIISTGVEERWESSWISWFSEFKELKERNGWCFWARATGYT